MNEKQERECILNIIKDMMDYIVSTEKTVAHYKNKIKHYKDKYKISDSELEMEQ